MLVATNGYDLHPDRHKIVVVLGSTEYADLQMGPQARLAYEGSVLVVPYPLERNAGRHLREMDDAGLLKAGAVLIRSPYVNGKYEPLMEAETQFAADKFIYFTTVCQALGAREVIAQQIRTRESDGTHTFSVSASGIVEQVPIEVASKTAYERAERILRKIRVHSVFVGGVPNCERALKLLEKYRIRDSQALALVDKRGGENPLLSERLTIDISSETKRVVDIAVDVGIPELLALRGKYEGVFHERGDCELDITVMF